MEHHHKNEFEHAVFLFQGGGALGAYQAGIFEGFEAKGIVPDWVAGISIGSINAAIIAGNAPKNRLQALHSFWESISFNPVIPEIADFGFHMHQAFNQVGASYSLLQGAASFFRPWPMPPFSYPEGRMEATCFYDTSPLRETLEKHIDFDRINAKIGSKERIRLSAGAVNVRTGNFVYFDSDLMKIGPEHIMASGALPPAFPAVEVDGEFYWDGGLVSNTPLDWVINNSANSAKITKDTMIVQVDLWDSVGEVPSNIYGVATRQKELQYASRTKTALNKFRRHHQHHMLAKHFLPFIPKEELKTEKGKELLQLASHPRYNILMFVYTAKPYESSSRDYNFTAKSISERWHTGLCDADRVLQHKEVYGLPKNHEGVHIFYAKDMDFS